MKNTKHQPHNAGEMFYFIPVIALFCHSGVRKTTGAEFSLSE